ncbi:MAG: hypothetical protein AW10_03984 [Candidatus Accumulibacter appositus]|uniref:Uncharacterized protein n=1 Tax=Candidatus Accumulibacter appositus TaxID=1454003 RepID=A0A011N3M6_9PROT|nr:MAG: hypothetical protein AW10_03984 [Candidatus Accumulibacter appositus]
MTNSKTSTPPELTAAENEKIQDLVAETRLSRAIKRHLAMNSPSNSKPSQTSTNKKPNE